MCLVHLLHAGNHVTAPDGTLTCPVQGTGCRRMVGFQWLSVMCEAHESFPCARLKMRIRTVRMEGRGWRKGAYYPYDLPRHCSVSIHYFTQVKSNRDSYLSTIFFFLIYHGHTNYYICTYNVWSGQYGFNTRYIRLFKAEQMTQEVPCHSNLDFSHDFCMIIRH